MGWNSWDYGTTVTEEEVLANAAFIKADDMLGPYFGAEIKAYRRAMDRSGREMVLSLSPGRALSLARLEHSAETRRCGGCRMTCGTCGKTSRPSSPG